MHCNLSLPYFNRLSLGCWENLEEKYLLKVEAFFPIQVFQNFHKRTNYMKKSGTSIALS